MRASSLDEKGRPYTMVQLGFTITADLLEFGVQLAWDCGYEATAEVVEDRLLAAIASYGVKGIDGMLANDISEKTRETARELFPTFYK